MINITKKKIIIVVYYFVPLILFGLAVRISLFNTVWLDEAFGVQLVKHSFGDMVSIINRDVHPPLYYFFLWVGVAAGNRLGINPIVSGKFVSLLPVFVLLIFSYTYVHKKFGRLASFLFSIFIIGMPQMLIYATEIRMYSFGMMWVTFAFFEAVKLVDARNEGGAREYVLLAIFSLLASYTHYFACISCIVIYALILSLSLLNKNFDVIKKALLSGIGVAIFYVPWLFIFIKQASVVGTNYWIHDVTVRSVLGNLSFLVLDGINTLFIIIIFIIGIVGAISMLISSRDYSAIMGLFVWGLTVLIGIVVSIMFRPIFMSRYSICSAACAWFGISLGINAVKNVKLKYAITILSILMCFSVCHTVVENERYKDFSTQKTISFITQNISEDTVFISNYYEHVQCTLAFYFPGHDNIAFSDNLTQIICDNYSDSNLKSYDSILEVPANMLQGAVLFDSSGLLKADIESLGYDVEEYGYMNLDYYGFYAYKIL